MNLLINYYCFSKISIFGCFFFLHSPGSARCRHVQFFLKRGGVCPLLCNSKYSVVSRQTSVFVGLFTAVEKLWINSPSAIFISSFTVVSFSFFLNVLYLHTFQRCFFCLVCFHSSWKLKQITTESLWQFWKMFCQPSRHSKVILHANKSPLLKAFPEKTAGWFLCILCPFKQTFPVRHRELYP